MSCCEACGHAHTCRDCDGPVSAASKTGRCRRCSLIALNADPAYAAKRDAALRAKMATPEWQANQARSGALGGKAKKPTREQLEQKRERRRATERQVVMHAKVLSDRVAPTAPAIDPISVGNIEAEIGCKMLLRRHIETGQHWISDPSEMANALRQSGMVAA